MQRKLLIFSLFVLALLTSCSHSLPQDAEALPYTPSLVPDYEDITVPCNIAPLNFLIDEDAEAYLTSVKVNGSEKTVIKGKSVCFNLHDWQRWLKEGKGGELTFEVYLKKEGRWYRYETIRDSISNDSIDEFLVYRLIAPSYVTYRKLNIAQRNLTNFDERVVYTNRTINSKKQSQCINCHSFQNYRTGNMQVHLRADLGGTLIVSDGKCKKVALKTEELLSPGVYPSWHPFKKLIAYSVNSTGQFFHKRNTEKVEVQDEASDLVLYDVEKDEVSFIRNDSNALETFPSWSPDGRWLYYVSAPYLPTEGLQTQGEALINRYREVRYSIYRLSFDPDTRCFGEPELVFDAPAQDRSATFPRISPDGRYLLYTSAEYGTFHIWHKSADLHLIDLKNGQERPLEKVNSPEVESYHSWSSNGRWMVFSSRRDDGSYTRPYFAWFGKDGKARKPFVLPQKQPGFYQDFYLSYNVPEFTKEPVRTSVRDFATVVRREPVQVQFSGRH